ncbi:MAG: hypothetical protein RIE52_00500 [Balneola sp.]|jgi:hypothetical protein
MQSYESEIETLFNEWKQKEPHSTNKNFIEDGIIDPVRWEKSETKVLFILREAYLEEGETEGFNLVKNLREEEHEKKGKSTWRNLAKWAALLTESITWDEKKDLPKDWFKYQEAFLSTALINVKKSGGEKTTDIEEIKSIAKEEKELLSRQIEIINPDIICCCGVFGSVKILWESIDQIGHRLYKTDKYTVIDYWHPATRWPQGLFYFGLKGIIDQRN